MTRLAPIIRHSDSRRVVDYRRGYCGYCIREYQDTGDTAGCPRKHAAHTFWTQTQPTYENSLVTCMELTAVWET